MPELARLAVLDDYQGASQDFGDWSALPTSIDVTRFTEPLPTPEAAVEALQGYDAVIAMRERTPFPAEVLDQLPDLRLLITTGPANDSFDVAAARARGVVVCGTGPGGIQPTIELTWALILAVARHVPAEDQRVRDGGWQRTIGHDIRGRRLGVVGLGNVGAAVAGIGQAFGMEVVAWSPNLDSERAAAAGVTAVDKDELFSTADVVSVHMKLSDATTGLVGERELGLMRPHATLVNTSRGPIVDGDALLAALEAGSIGGAGLDVFADEPLPADSPWRSAPRTVLTPHLGFVSEDTYETFYAEAIEDVIAYLDDAPIREIR